MNRLSLAAAAALLSLAACGDDASDALEEAAEQSTPAAANLLENRAEALEERDVDASLSAPGSPVQEAMEDAGEVAAEALPEGQDQAGTNAQ